MKLSIIIPCYNEEKDISLKVDVVKKYLFDNQIDAEIILVNDGSKDNTMKVITSIDGVKAIGYENNRGKGGAIQYGIFNSSGDYILFMDADLSTDISSIKKVIELSESYDFIIGSRHAKNSVLKIKQPLKRRFIGWCCRVLVNMVFHFHFKDTQCGFKAMKKSVAIDIANKQKINGFAFDVEYLYIAKLNKCSLCEFGVTWSDDRGSTVSPLKSSIRFFKDIWKIRRNKKHYVKKQD